MVSGANGRLGRAAVLAFAAAGWPVTAQLRRAPRAPLPAGVRLLECDALNLATLAERRVQLAPPTALNHAGFTLTGAELQAAFEAALGRPLRRAAFPWSLLRLATPFSPLLRALFEMRYLWQRPQRLDDGRLRALLGEVPQTALGEVVRQCLAALPMPDAQNLNSARRFTVV